MSILAIGSFLNLYKRSAKNNKSSKVNTYNSGYDSMPNRMTAPLKSDVVEFSNDPKGYTGWVEFPSAKHDSKNFIQNIKTLKLLWNKNWQTSEYSDSSSLQNALMQNDFHIYYNNGTPIMAEIGRAHV